MTNTIVRRKRRPLILAALAILAIAVVSWMKPWADSVTAFSVIVATDEDGSVIVHRGRQWFSSGRESRPLATTEIDLQPWIGKLLMVEVRGHVAPRWADLGAIGHLGCAAELLGPDGAVPLEFTDWHGAPEVGFHLGPIGPRTFLLDAVDGRRFYYAAQGNLRHVLRVPPGGRLRLSLRPVLPDNVQGRPQPAVPSPGLLYTAWSAEEPHPLDPPPDVFIYLIDAVRADHLGCYGYPRGTSPNIDAFAREATVYHQAQTASTWTRPSVASLLTGLYPMVHRAVHHPDILDESFVLLPEMLQEAGYATFAIVSNLNLTADFGFDQGYHRYIEKHIASYRWINRRAAEILATRDPSRPTFMYVHTVEPHHPYFPRPEIFSRFDRGFSGKCDGSVDALDKAGSVNPRLSQEDVEHLIDLYDAELFDADRGFGEFLDILRRVGRYDNALIILLADHGESFADHDTILHGRSLNREEMRVPLIVHYPRGRRGGSHVRSRVSLLDLLPTVLVEAGLRPKLDYALPGRHLQSVANDPQAQIGRLLFGDVSYLDDERLHLVAVIDEDGYKRVLDVSVVPRELATDESLGLWNTESDPTESRDLSGTMPVRATYCDQLIVRWLHEQLLWRQSEGAAPPPPAKPTDELKKDLRTLGYLE